MRPADPVTPRLAALASIMAIAAPLARADDYALAAARVGATGPAAASAAYDLAPSHFGGAVTVASSAAYGLAPGFAAQTGNPEVFLAGPAGTPTLNLPASAAGSAPAATALTLRIYGAHGDLTLAAPAGYELSRLPGSGFAASLVIPSAEATPPGLTLYLRVAVTAPVGALGGVITLTGATLPAPSFSLATIITGPVAVADFVSKPTNGTDLKIPVSVLLANDYRVTATGEAATTGFTLTAVTSGAGNAATLSGGRVFFTANPAAASETFTYTLSDGTATATGIVTVSTPAPAPFTLQLVSVGTAVYDGENTSATYAFIGVPNQLYTLQYTNDLTEAWTTLPDTSTGPTGSFAVTVTAPGDHAALWNTRIFFRAVRTP